MHNNNNIFTYGDGRKGPPAGNKINAQSMNAPAHGTSAGDLPEGVD
jgi:hypothetical protein